MSISNIGGQPFARLDLTRTTSGPAATVRQESETADTSGLLEGAELGAAIHAQRWDLAAGGYSAAYRIKIGDWVGTGYIPAGAGKAELQKFTDEVMDYARRMRGMIDGRTEDDMVEFRFADPGSVATEQKIIQLSAQSFTSGLATPQEAGATSLLANLLTDFLDKLRGNPAKRPDADDQAPSRTITDLFMGLDIRT
jgi:hypothetical protein